MRELRMDDNVNLNMKYSFLTTMYERDIRMYTIVTPHGDLVMSPTMIFKSKIINYIFLPEIRTFGLTHFHTLWPCMFMFMLTFLSKNIPSISERWKRNQARK